MLDELTPHIDEAAKQLQEMLEEDEQKLMELLDERSIESFALQEVMKHGNHKQITKFRKRIAAIDRRIVELEGLDVHLSDDMSDYEKAEYLIKKGFDIRFAGVKGTWNYEVFICSWHGTTNHPYGKGVSINLNVSDFEMKTLEKIRDELK